MANLPHLKTPILCYDKAKVIACPQCKVKAGAVCIRIDGKGSRTHRARVIKWENGAYDELLNNLKYSE